jgi:hypothetical protein
MKNNLFDWPAFGQVQDLPDDLPYERGVWGKVHGEQSDFRWIARSSGFDRGGEPELSRQLNVGTEDQPVRSQLWQSHGDPFYYAAGLYPSRATDSSGRTSFLEKQVLAWKRPPEIPAVLGALLLLPHASTLGDEIWWERSASQNWTDLDFSLEIAPSKPMELPVDAGELAVVVARAITALQEQVGHDKLAAFYANLLAKKRPVCLTGLSRPLPPEALAALLLILPRPLADTLSLAGWIPSSRAPLEDLGSRWDLLVLPPEMQEMVESIEVDHDTEAGGWALAQGLLEGDLELARSVFHSVSTRAEPIAPPPSAEARHCKKPEPHSPSAAWRSRDEIKLPPPPDGASTLLRQLHAFACAVDRRWLDPELLKQQSGPPHPVEESPADLIQTWIKQLDDERPARAESKQWTVKLDLLRSAALTFWPSPDVLRRIEIPPSGGRVSALLFALALEPKGWDALKNLGNKGLEQVLEQSLSCIPNIWTRRVYEKIVQWRGINHRNDPKVAQLIQRALDRNPVQPPVL